MLKVYGKTDTGKVREVNQDCFAHGSLGEMVEWAVVCDGMGGENSGDVASQMAVDVIGQHILQNYRQGMGINSIRAMILTAINAANAAIFERAQQSEAFHGMGTTVVVTVVRDGVAHIAHAGDSRAYLVTGQELSQITRDHSVVQMMVEKGQITTEEARIHPQKNYITRALGVENSLEIDYCEVELGAGDRLLLCTDGLTNYLDESAIFEVLQSERNPDAACERLIEGANAGGGRDNITVVLFVPCED